MDEASTAGLTTLIVATVIVCLWCIGSIATAFTLALLNRRDSPMLTNLAHDIDDAITKVDEVLAFVTKYDSFLPAKFTEPISLLASVLGTVKALLDHVPA